MLVCKVELWPDGNAEKAENLGILSIVNRGRFGLDADSDQFEYDVQLQSFQTGTTKAPAKLTRAHIVHWRRRGWVTLVRKAFQGVDRG